MPFVSTDIEYGRSSLPSNCTRKVPETVGSWGARMSMRKPGASWVSGVISPAPGSVSSTGAAGASAGGGVSEDLAHAGIALVTIRVWMRMREMTRTLIAGFRNISLQYLKIVRGATAECEKLNKLQ